MQHDEPATSHIPGEPLSAAADIHETEIDGIQTFWADIDGPLTATLMFRVGAQDEELLTRGITHLVEHLALVHLRGVQYAYNGSVLVDQTVFWATGSGEQVAEFLESVSKSITDLPTERLDAEAGVLAAEAANRPHTNYENLLAVLYGPNGPGLVNFDEYGLGWLSPDRLQEWADRCFVKRNAVLTLTGRPPENLKIPLRVGSPQSTTLPNGDVGFRPEGQIALNSQPAGICLGAIAERSSELVMGLGILQVRLTDRLRYEHGLVYSVIGSYQPLDRNHAYVFVGADCEPSRTADVNREFMAELRDFSAIGPTDTERERFLKMAKTVGDTDPASVTRGLLFEKATRELLDHEHIDLDQVIAEYEAAEARDLAAAVDVAFKDALVVPGDGVDLGMKARPRKNYPPVTPGTQFFPKSIRDDLRALLFSQRFMADLRVLISSVSSEGTSAAIGDLRVLVIGKEGISACTAQRCVTIRWDDLAAVVHESDTVRSIYARSGAWMLLDTSAWRRSAKLLLMFDEAVPSDRVLPAYRAKD